MQFSLTYCDFFPFTITHTGYESTTEIHRVCCYKYQLCKEYMFYSLSLSHSLTLSLPLSLSLVYLRDEIAYLMECADLNKDGLLDYLEFTERFYQPAANIGFHLCVLIVHLSDHLPEDLRLEKFMSCPNAKQLMEHFEKNMGCIEILGKSKRIERVYFEVKESRLRQWDEPHIQESRRNFLHSVELGSQKRKLQGFVSFCEDTIFEVRE